jgi:hypothetical protein
LRCKFEFGRDVFVGGAIAGARRGWFCMADERSLAWAFLPRTGAPRREGTSCAQGGSGAGVPLTGVPAIRMSLGSTGLAASSQGNKMLALKELPTRFRLEK